MAFKKLTGKLGLVNAKHLAYRATFNPNQKLIKDLANMEVDVAVNFLIRKGLKQVKISNTNRWVYDYTDQPRDLEYGKYFIPTHRNPYNSSTFTDISKSKEPNYQYDNAIYSWWLNELINCQGTHFKVAFFLHIQFICNLKSGRLGGNIFDPFDYLDLINFFVNRSMNDLAKRITIVDAMTRYYDNNINILENTDENLGRELMELFTVQNIDGVLPYTQSDVNASSKVISGYKPNTLKVNGKKLSMDAIVKERISHTDVYSGVPLSYIDASRHYNKDKTFGKYFGNKVIKGSSTALGIEGEKNQLIDMLFAAPNTSVAYAKNLFHYFVGIYITNDLDKRIVANLSESLKKNKYNLNKVLSELFTSREFYELTTGSGVDLPAYKQGQQYFGGKIKSPLEFALIILDHLNIKPPSTIKNNAYSFQALNYFFNKYIRQFCLSSGMELFNVGIDGYQYAFRQTEYDRSWVTPSAVIVRRNFVGDLVRNKINAKKFVDATFFEPNIPENLLIQLLNYFLVRPYDKNSPEFQALKTMMLGNLTEMNWKNDYSNGINTEGINAQLEETIYTILISPDYLLL